MNKSNSPLKSPRHRTVLLLAAAIFLVGATQSSLRAADVTWNNDQGSFLWNLTDLNWSSRAWNNFNGDGAVFTSTGVGAINVNAPINVNSLGFLASGYTLNGPGPINLVNGSSTL